MWLLKLPLKVIHAKNNTAHTLTYALYVLAIGIFIML